MWGSVFLRHARTPWWPRGFELRKHPGIIDLIRDFANTGKLIGAICAAPLLLVDAGVITSNSAYTAHGSTVDEIPQLIQNQPVVQDGQLITSRGAGTAVEFGLCLIKCLFGIEKEHEIRASIHADRR